MEASALAAAFDAAIEIGLLWLIAEEPVDGSTIAQTLSVPVRRCSYWFQLLHSLGFVLSKSIRIPDYSMWTLEDLESGLRRAGLEVLPIVELAYFNWKMIQANKR